jgi:Zn-dependent protease
MKSRVGCVAEAAGACLWGFAGGATGVRAVAVPGLGVPVYIHWSVLIGLPVSIVASHGIVGGVLGFASLLVLLLVHEAGHAFVARRLGLTVWEVRTYFLFGRCYTEQTGCERDEVLVAWGGILGQLVLFLPFAGIAYLAYSLRTTIPSVMNPVFIVFNGVNVAIAAVNLLPIPFLDGYMAWRILRVRISDPGAIRRCDSPRRPGRSRNHLRVVRDRDDV